MLDDIKKTLWASADKLRANMDAAEYKHLVLGLIFVKYISDAFVARQAELTLRLRDPADELFYGDAADEDIAAELEDRDYYTSENVFWVPEGARWDALRAAAPQPDIGKRIDDALTLIFGRNWGGWGMRSEPNKKETSAPVTAARSGRGRGSSEAYRLILS